MIMDFGSRLEERDINEWGRQCRILLSVFSGLWSLPAILRIVYFSLNINFPISGPAFWKAGGINKNLYKCPKMSPVYDVTN